MSSHGRTTTSSVATPPRDEAMELPHCDRAGQAPATEQEQFVSKRQLCHMEHSHCGERVASPGKRLGGDVVGGQALAAPSAFAGRSLSPHRTSSSRLRNPSSGQLAGDPARVVLADCVGHVRFRFAWPRPLALA
ncbi:Protein of unknown function, partial [Gryllus bimaculatus]